ncbi:hypothetical protein [Bradyrhizobium guangdongense]|uniref:hypothetical protein n=1 Tax=Bradyrhizobium guangdongense TaxID=1325090 RepID=UPI00131A40E6|nr:hypothetical protein [Bradyrhizobium guangdongense]
MADLVECRKQQPVFTQVPVECEAAKQSNDLLLSNAESLRIEGGAGLINQRLNLRKRFPARLENSVQERATFAGSILLSNS